MKILRHRLSPGRLDSGSCTLGASGCLRGTPIEFATPSVATTPPYPRQEPPIDPGSARTSEQIHATLDDGRINTSGTEISSAILSVVGCANCKFVQLQNKITKAYTIYS